MENWLKLYQALKMEGDEDYFLKVYILKIYFANINYIFSYIKIAIYNT